MDLKIVLGKEEVLKLCEKDKNFEVYIQRAALNYIRNNKLKPLLKEEVVREIEEYKRDLSKHVKEALKEIGITENNSYYSPSVSMSNALKEKLQQEVRSEMGTFIAATVKAELATIYARMKSEADMWEKTVERMCKENLTEAKLKIIAKEVLRERIAKLV